MARKNTTAEANYIHEIVGEIMQETFNPLDAAAVLGYLSAQVTYVNAMKRIEWKTDNLKRRMNERYPGGEA